MLVRTVPVGPQALNSLVGKNVAGPKTGAGPSEPAQFVKIGLVITKLVVGAEGVHGEGEDSLSTQGLLLLAWKLLPIVEVVSVLSNDPM